MNGDLSRLSTDQVMDLNALRKRLARMSDAELRRFGQSARSLCSPGANFNKPPRDVFLIQLMEARAEWRRRRAFEK